MDTIHSFELAVSDQAGRTLERFVVPITGAALFINPLFHLLPGIDVSALREPWYRLVPRRLITGPLRDPPLRPALPPTNPPITLLPDPLDPVRVIRVTLFDLERELYQADYSTVDVFGPLLTYLLRRRIAEGAYRAEDGPFRVLVTPQTAGGDRALFDLLPPEVSVEGVFPLPVPRGPGPRTTFQRVTQHHHPARALDSFGALHTHQPALGGRNRLIWQPSAFAALAHSQPVSPHVEVGGYLLGQVYAQADAPATLLVEVQQVLAAEATSASATLLLFTGESWSALRRRLAGDLRGMQLLGWWHTHLFPASPSFGLSGLDEELHRAFFSSPWHFAALLNVSPEQGRVLRCYQNDADGVLRECAFAVAPIALPGEAYA